MTQTRSWLALGALLAAIIGGTVWAADQKKTVPDCCAEGATCPAAHKACTADVCVEKEKTCCEQKCSTKETSCCTAEKGCCEGKCCAAEKEKAKGCCADGPCCGCCAAKAKADKGLVVAPGGTVNVIVGAPEAGFLTSMPAPPAPACCVVPATPALAPPAPLPPPQYAPVAQCVSTATSLPAQPAFAAAWNGQPAPWRMCVVKENGKAHLGMQAGPGTAPCVTCEGMVIKVGGEALKVAVDGKQVCVAGKCVRATADSVCWGAGHGDIVLAGSVKLKYDTDAHKAEITAEHVVVGVSDGRIEIHGMGSLEQHKAAAVICPASLEYQVPVGTSPEEKQQLFNFWTGFSR